MQFVQSQVKAGGGCVGCDFSPTIQNYSHL